jgi:hypothetical protein
VECLIVHRLPEAKIHDTNEDKGIQAFNLVPEKRMSHSKYLVFSSVGDRNNIDSWLSEPDKKEFDLAVHYFGNEDEPGLAADYVLKRKGLKFPNFRDFVGAGGLHGYDAVWVADDDIIMDTESINRMFKIFSDYRLLVAQPSFDRACRRPWAHTFTNPEFILRYTNFVENGVVVFATEIVAQFMKTFGDAGTGFGVDFIWPSILGFPTNRIAIIDAVSCFHPNDRYSSLDALVPRPLHMVQGTELLIDYGLLPKETDISDGSFVHPYEVREFGGVRR